jgi:simple sugar transport system ATP-binding protein
MEHITKQYYGNKVLDDVCLSLQAGQVRALIGENGAGKSTLMNVLFGMPVIWSTGGYEGTITLKGSPARFRSPREAMAAGIGMVHQEFMLIPGFRACENIKLNREPVHAGPLGRLLGPSLQFLDLPRMSSDATEALSSLGLSIDDWAPVSGLPVGHKQFVEIAREIDKRDLSVLVMDEPTAVLTENEAAVLVEALRLLQSKGIGVLFITHRLGEVLGFADQVTVLRDGRVVADIPAPGADLETLASLLVGRPFSRSEHARRPEASTPARPLLVIRGLDVAMSGERVKGIDLDVMEGEILGIAGLAGQGKAGIANGLMGLFPTTGHVTKGGEPVKLNDPLASLDAGFAFLSEDRRGAGLLLDESLEVNLAFSLIVYKKAFRLPGAPGRFGAIDWRQVRTHCRQMVSDLDIRCTGPGQRARTLSGGNQQKACFARAISLDPDVLLASEPTRGIDVGARERILHLVVQVNRERRTTVILTSSDLGELRQVCDRIAIVYAGRVAGILPPDAPDSQYGLLMSGKEVAR